MTTTAASNGKGEALAIPLPGLALAGALAGFLALQITAFILAGTFEYPLDDTYIHLAMAEGIAHGHLGINPGDPVAASSSILYPVLLVPFPGSELQRLLPLAWNVLGLLLAAWFWGAAVQSAHGAGSLGARPAMLIACLGPVALNMHGVAFTGMENSLQGAASLAIVLGLWRFLKQGQLARSFMIAAVVAPLLRYECLAISLGAVAIIGLAGARRAALGMAAAIIVPVVAFSFLLVQLGLDPLPGSVLAKVGLAGADLGMADRLTLNVARTLGKPQGPFFAALVILTLALAVLWSGPARTLLALVGLAGLAHLLFAQIGWMHRYEYYLIVTIFAAIVLAAERRRQIVQLVLPLLAFAVPLYQVEVIDEYVWNPAAIHHQQVQMARFERDFLQAPVAVNDVGRMAWANDRQVYDLWGLGSRDALMVRLGDPHGAWAAPLLDRHGIDYAMIYEKWFGTALGPDWTAVADLTMWRKIGRIGDWRVTFYARGTAQVALLAEKLTKFAPTLPEGAALALRGGVVAPD